MPKLVDQHIGAIILRKLSLWFTFSSNNFCVILSVCHCGGILFQLFISRLLQFIDVCICQVEFFLQPSCCRFTAVLWDLASIILGHATSCCTIQFQPSFGCQTEGLTHNSWIRRYIEEFVVNLVTARVLWLQKRVQTITHPPPCLTDDVRCLC